MASVSLDVSIDQNELATQIALQLEPEEVIELMKKIDVEVAEWEFTSNVASYFHNELAKLHNKEKER